MNTTERRLQRARRICVGMVVLLGLLGVVSPTVARVQAPPGAAAPDAFLQPLQRRFAPDPRLAVFDVTATVEEGRLVLRGEVETTEARNAVISAARAAGYEQVVDRMLVVPDPSLGSDRVGIITVSVANLRGKPAHSAELVTQAVMGVEVSALYRAGGWLYVRAGAERYLGWVEDGQVALTSPDGLEAWRRSPRLMVTAPFALVREGADTASLPVSDVVAGGSLRYDGEKNSWFRVALPDGRTGYLDAGAALPLDRWRTTYPPTPDGVERTALQFMGVPYLWGGTSAKGFDCSGYTKTVFRLHGVELARDADQQAVEGEAVPLDQGYTPFKKGDLLFFTARPTPDRSGAITHVGIYLGGGEFVHASGRVKRNSFDPASPIYSETLLKRLAGVRRVLPATLPTSASR